MSLWCVTAAEAGAYDPPPERRPLDEAAEAEERPGFALSRRRVLARVCLPALALPLAPVAPAAESALADRRRATPVEVQYWTTALLHTHINAFREEHGLHILGRSVRLDQSADAHAVDMAQHDFIAHDSSDGTDFFTRVRHYYPYETWVGENLAAGFDSATAAFQGWVDSPPHRDNLLRPEFWALGLACAYRDGSTYGWYWVADFGGFLDEG
jgi:uncharacterized protein YkwD